MLFLPPLSRSTHFLETLSLLVWIARNVRMQFLVRHFFVTVNPPQRCKDRRGMVPLCPPSPVSHPNQFTQRKRVRVYADFTGKPVDDFGN